METNAIRNTRALGACVAAVLICMAGARAGSAAEPATATSAGAGAADDSTAGQLVEIVVTARKRAERSQDVPVAITPISSEDIERSGATTLVGLNGLAPGVSLQNFALFPFQLTAVIRGEGTADFEPSSDPAVAVLVDGVYQPSTNGAALGLLDVDSVEMLRGPQGTLFGRDATAGAILIQTKRPSDQFGVDAQVTVGNYGENNYASAVTGPLLDHVLDFRLAGSDENAKGFYHNYDGRTLGDVDRYSFRPSLLFTPNDDLTVFLTVGYARDTSQTLPGINAGAGGIPGEPGGDAANRSEFNSTLNGSLAYESIDRSITLNADYHTEPGTYTLIAGYRKFYYTGNFDADGTPFTTVQVNRIEDHNQRSLEGRFASAFNGPFNFVAGLYGAGHDYSLSYLGDNASFFTGPPFNLPPTATGLPVLTIANAQQEQALAAYFQGTYKFTSRLSADFGANYSTEKKTFDFDQATVFFVPETPVILRHSWDNLGPKAGLNYKATDDTLLYATYSRGFRSGGFNGRAFDPRNLGPYQPEKVDAYEAGIKSDLLDKTLRVNVSTYYNKYKDLQRPFANLVGYNGTAPNPLELVTFNAASANIDGVETELTYLPVRGLTLNASVAYMDARYTNFTNPAGGGSLDYLKLAYAPRWTSRLAALYEFPVSQDWKSALSMDFNYSSSEETDTINSPFDHRAPTHLLNASWALGTADSRFKAELWVKNLTNDIYVVSGQNSAPIFNIFTLDAPRTYGVTLSTRL